MCCLFLIMAILFETIGTTALKLSQGFTVVIPSVLTVVFYILCFWLLAQALKHIDVSIAYAIWGAFGILLISIIGMVFFKEPVSITKIISILLIIVGTIGLRLAI